jgi:DNA-binding NarL/FixJ family response regulator
MPPRKYFEEIQLSPEVAATAAHISHVTKRTPETAPTRKPSAASAKTRPISIVVVDDHRFMRELISAMLARQEGRYKVVAEKGDATTAIQACKELLPDLLILDINLPDLCGIEAVPQIRKHAPQTRILLCTAFVTDDRVIDALRSGADGFVEKTNTWDDFIEAVHRVSGGEHFFRSQSSLALTESGEATKQSALPAPPVTPLSPREKEVLSLIADGDSSKEIAAKLHIGVGTVETHRARLLSKLKVRNVAGLVSYAFRSGLMRLRAHRSPPQMLIPFLAVYRISEIAESLFSGTT